MNKLLLVIDVQNDFINNNTKDVKDRISELVNSKEYNYIVFIKFINNENSIWYKRLDYKGCLLSNGQEIAINTNYHKIINKNTYTALNDELKQFIDENNIDEIFLCGFDTDACVYKTALDLFENNYNIYVLENYTMSHKGLELHNIFINNLKRLIGKDNVI